MRDAWKERLVTMDAKRTRFSPAVPITAVEIPAPKLFSRASTVTSTFLPQCSAASIKETSPALIEISVGLAARPLMTMTSKPDSLNDALNGPSTWVSPIPFVSGLFAQTARDASPT